MLRKAPPGILWLAAGVLLALKAGSIGAGIPDPIRDFLATVDRRADDELLILRTDLNNDGKQEILLSLSHETDARAGNIWTVYIPASGVYGKLQQPVVFPADAFCINEDLLPNGRALMFYHPGGGGKGALLAYQFDGFRFRQTNLGQIAPQEEDRDLFAKLFESPVTNKVEIIPAAELDSLANARTPSPEIAEDTSKSVSGRNGPNASSKPKPFISSDPTTDNSGTTTVILAFCSLCVLAIVVVAVGRHRE